MDEIIVEVFRRPKESWGLKISGEAPCLVESIKPDSPCEEAGLQVGDQLCAVNGCDVIDEDHHSVVALIRESGVMMRLRVQPSTRPAIAQPLQVQKQQSERQPTEASSSWFNDSAAADDDDKSTSSEEDDNDNDKFDHTNYEKYCQLLSELSLDREDKEFDIRPKYEDVMSEEVDQRKFIITASDQREFDQKYDAQESIFQGSKAAVAGAFTGDHNVIRGDGDVRGVHKRVKAGIQHFSYSNEEVKAGDRGKLIIYTTSLGVNRIISSECEEVRKIFFRYRVRFEDRDIFKDPAHKVELYERLKLDSGKPLPHIPRVYIDGVYVGGFNELNAMSDCGDLRIRLKDYPKYNYRSSCGTCKSSGRVVCGSCNGKTYRSKTRFRQLKCGTCKQQGSLQCPDCLS